MKNKIRLVVYSTLALPPIALGVFAMSLDPGGRVGFFAEFKQNTMNLLTGNFDVASLFSAKRTARRERGRGWAGSSGRNLDPPAIFARLDKDSDGKLAGDEIGQRLRGHLERLDADENGAMTLDEFQLGMQTMYTHF